MFMNKIFVLLAIMAATAYESKAQGYIETEYVTASDMCDDSGTAIGDGDMMSVKGRYTLPLSASLNERRQPTAWSATASAAYYSMRNHGEASVLNPDEVVNASLNISHTRPLSARWMLMASLGAGVYASPDELAWRSLLANGAVIFAYKVSDNLSLGVGAGLTNSYGAPMVLPMGYLSWRTNGDVKVTVDMSSGMSVKASAMLNRVVGIEMTAIDIGGMSAVRRIDGKSKVYSMMFMKSALTPVFRLSNHLQLRAGVGGVWLRTIRMTDRSLKGFFNSFGSDADKYHFRPSLRFNVSLNYHI